MATASGRTGEPRFLKAVLTFLCAYFGYVIYDAISSAATEQFQRLLMIFPLLLVITVHWLSSYDGVDAPNVAGSDQAAAAGDSPWGIATVLFLIFMFCLIYYQSSLHGLIFTFIFIVFVATALYFLCT